MSFQRNPANVVTFYEIVLQQYKTWLRGARDILDKKLDQYIEFNDTSAVRALNSRLKNEGNSVRIKNS